MWFAYREHLVDWRRRPATVRASKVVLHAFWGTLQPRPWHQARKRDLVAFCGRPGLKPASSLHYHKRVTAFYRWAQRTGRTGHDPFAETAPPPAPVQRPRALDLDQVGRLLADVARDGRLELMCWLMFGLGLRAGEVAAADVADVQWQPRPELLVRGKGGKQRVVPLSAPVARVLRGWLARPDVPQGGALVGRRGHDGELTAAHLRPVQVGLLVRDALRRIGIQETSHALRHSFAVTLKRNGASVLALSRLLGHSSTAVTERVYLAAFHDEETAAMALLPDPGGTS